MKTGLRVLLAALVLVSAASADAQSNRGVGSSSNSLSGALGTTDATGRQVSSLGLETQVVVRADRGTLPLGVEETVKRELARVVAQYDQPAGGRTMVRVSAVWQPLAGQWRMFFRVVADHLVYAQNTWIRLGDSKTVSVVEVPSNFGHTLSQALDMAVQIAVEGKK